jgi:hypothetical protein
MSTAHGEDTTSTSGVKRKMYDKLYDDGKQLTEEYMSLKNDVNELKKAGKILRMQIEKSEKKVEDFSKTLHDFLIVALQNVDEEDEDNTKIPESTLFKKKIKKMRKEVEGNWICPSCSKPVKPTVDGKVKKSHSKNNDCGGGGSDAKRTDSYHKEISKDINEDKKEKEKMESK